MNGMTAGDAAQHGICRICKDSRPMLADSIQEANPPRWIIDGDGPDFVHPSCREAILETRRMIAEANIASGTLD